MANVPLRCSCGKVQGTAHNISAKTGTRVICHCDDCQKFAQYLGREDDVLDVRGGTDIFQFKPEQVSITSGLEQLRSVQLTEKGLIRWYTHCCKTPIGNTISAAFPFIGMVHTFMDGEGSREDVLGPVRYAIQGKFAKGDASDPSIHDGVPLIMLLRLVPRLLLARALGSAAPSPFFDAAGEAISPPARVAERIDT